MSEKIFIMFVKFLAKNSLTDDGYRIFNQRLEYHLWRERLPELWEWAKDIADQAGDLFEDLLEAPEVAVAALPPGKLEDLGGFFEPFRHQLAAYTDPTFIVSESVINLPDGSSIELFDPSNPIIQAGGDSLDAGFDLLETIWSFVKGLLEVIFGLFGFGSS